MTDQVELERGKTEAHRVGRRITRSRRWWAVVAVSAVLTLGLAYEFIRFGHAVVGHMPALVVAVLLGVAVVVVVADPGRSRIGRALLGVVLAVGTVLATFDGAASHGGWQLLANPSDCRLGGWEPATFDLVGARSLQEKVPSQHNLLFTKIG